MKPTARPQETFRKGMPAAWLAPLLVLSPLLLEAQTSPPSHEPPAPAASPDPSAELKQALQDQERALAELRRKVAAQQKELEEQRARLEALDRHERTLGEAALAQAEIKAQMEEQEKRIAELSAALLAAQNQVLELQEKMPKTSLNEMVEERLKKLETSIEQRPEISQTVTAGDFPGSMRIPGTDAALKIGGQVNVNMIWNLDALGVDDRFSTAAIPMEGSEAAGKGPRMTLTARSSRFNFDVRMPSAVGAFRAFIEADFAGASNTLRLRHAFGQWATVLAGQTWSTFADPEAEPDGIDFEGLNAISLLRQAQVRWTVPLKTRFALALAIENPRCSIEGAACISQFPDVIARLRWEQVRFLGHEGHIQAALILRQLRAEPPDQANQVKQASGWGATMSGSLSVPKWGPLDRFRHALYLGKGIGSYIADLDAAGEQDAVYDAATETLRPLFMGAAYVGYEHWWTDQLRSTLTCGFVTVDNEDLQGPDAYRMTRRYTLNLAFSPIARLDTVAEFLTGERINRDGQRGRASQVQIGARFRF